MSRNTYQTIMLLAREQGITYTNLYRLCLQVTGREDRSWSSFTNELSVMSQEHATELLHVMRDLPVSDEGRAWYAQQDELMRKMLERDRKLAARMNLDDPHLRAQREGWEL